MHYILFILYPFISYLYFYLFLYLLFLYTSVYGIPSHFVASKILLKGEQVGGLGIISVMNLLPRNSCLNLVPVEQVREIDFCFIIFIFFTRHHNLKLMNVYY